MQDADSSAQPSEASPSFPLMQGVTDHQAQSAGTIEARDIDATNVVSGTLYIHQQTIYQVAGNLSLAADRSGGSGPGPDELAALTLPAAWNIPYPRNPVFTGREEVLERLAKSLRPGQPMAISQPQAMSGLGGIGKTQLAVEYAYRHRHDYQAVLWAGADSREALISAFVVMAALLNLPEQEAQEQMIAVNAVKAWLHKHTEWLLILDNADDLPIIQEFLPPTLGGHVLLTTRAQALGRLANRIEVGTLDLETGTMFLLRRAGLLALHTPLEQAEETDQQLARQLCQELGGLPLALDQAGAYIEETQCSLEQYLDLYRRHRPDLLRQRGGLIQDHPESVATTWSLSFAAIEERNAAAADLLRVCALLHPDAIPEEVFVRGAAHLGPRLAAIDNNPLVLNSMLAVIQGYSLLQRNSREWRLSMHRLVQAVLKDAMDKETHQQWAERTVQAADQVGYYFLQHPGYTEAEPLLQSALTIREQLLGPDHLETVKSINSLAGLYRLQGKYSLAEQLFRRALATRERILGREHLEVAESLDGLAWCSYDQHQYQLAERLAQQALTIREHILGKEHPDVVASMSILGLAYRDQGKDAQAEALFQETLDISKNVFEPDHPELAYCYNNVATAYIRQGKYTEAEPLLKQALAIREKKLGSEHPDLADSLLDYAICLSNSSDVSKRAQVESLYQRSVAIYEQAHGHDHPYLAIALTNLARLYRDQHKYKEAEPLYRRVLVIHEQQLGPNHPDTAESLQRLANLYRQYRDKYEEAERLYRRALAINEQALGVNHPCVADTLNDFANLYSDQSQNEQAEALYQQALTIYEQQVGPIPPNIVISLNNLASLYRRQSKYEQAEPLLLRALAIRENQLGPEHPDTATSLNDLAALYYAQGKYEQAEPLLLRALVIREQRLGPEHPHTIATRTRYVHLLRAHGRSKDAALEATSIQQATSSDQEPC